MAGDEKRTILISKRAETKLVELTEKIRAERPGLALSHEDLITAMLDFSEIPQRKPAPKGQTPDPKDDQSTLKNVAIECIHTLDINASKYNIQNGFGKKVVEVEVSRKTWKRLGQKASEYESQCEVEPGDIVENLLALVTYAERYHDEKLRTKMKLLFLGEIFKYLD